MPVFFPLRFMFQIHAEDIVLKQKSHHASTLLKAFHGAPPPRPALAFRIKPKQVNTEKSSLVSPSPASPCYHSLSCIGVFTSQTMLIFISCGDLFLLCPIYLLHLVSSQESTEVPDSTPLASLPPGGFL